jgi:hypothetical protein
VATLQGQAKVRSSTHRRAPPQKRGTTRGGSGTDTSWRPNQTQAGELCAEAEMDAGSEGQDLPLVAGDVERVRGW